MAEAVQPAVDHSPDLSKSMSRELLGDAVGKTNQGHMERTPTTHPGQAKAAEFGLDSRGALWTMPRQKKIKSESMARKSRGGGIRGGEVLQVHPDLL